MKKKALLSVSDKSNLIEFAKSLIELDFDLLATGNTARLLTENNLNCTQISDYTQFPEVFDGRVKTLHPKIFGGILLRRNNKNDVEEAGKNNIFNIDLVCVNLYPFEKFKDRTDVSIDEKLENIDIGGPSLIRAAAKNYESVLVVTNPSQYDSLIQILKGGEVPLETRRKLAYDAFSHTANYDNMIAGFFEKEFNIQPEFLRLSEPLQKKLRYGENPHQSAYLFGKFFDYFEVLHGKELSYNNIVDLTSAVDLVNELPEISCAIIKHTNPCGAALGKTTLEAYQEALSCDPVSAFGGIAAFNSTVDAETANKLNEIFLEIVCAPNYTKEANEILKKKKNRRIIKLLHSGNNSKQIKSVTGGYLLQDKDNSKLTDDKFRTVTKKTYTQKEAGDLKFAWIVCKHTKSNAIVYVKNKKAIGVGAGQMSRVESAKLAALRAKEFGHNLEGAVAASDAFFPFPDGIEVIAKNGITSIIQPGGSIRDKDVIQAADNLGLSMVFTGIRNFKH